MRICDVCKQGDATVQPVLTVRVALAGAVTAPASGREGTIEAKCLDQLLPIGYTTPTNWDPLKPPTVLAPVITDMCGGCRRYYGALVQDAYNKLFKDRARPNYRPDYKAVTGTPWEIKETMESQKVVELFKSHGYDFCHAYRFNAASLRVRIIDSDFTNKPNIERHHMIDGVLAELPPEIERDIISVLLYARAEEAQADPANTAFERMDL